MKISSYPLAYEDGTDSVPKCWKLQRPMNHPEESTEYFFPVGRYVVFSNKIE
jgi:hypothetical protein